MTQPSTEHERFLADLARTERRRVIVALVLAPFLYVLFGLLDLQMYPEALPRLAAVRGAAAFGMAVVLLSALRVRRYWPLVLHAAAVFLLAAGGVAVMCHLTGGHASPYYAGLAVCVVFVAAFVTWPVGFSAAVFASVLAVYYVPMAFEPRVEGRLLVMHSFFLLSTVAVALAGMSLRNTLALQEYRGRVRLTEANDALRETQRLKDRMFQNVSHELRTPLTLILTPLQGVAEASETPPSQRRALRSMHRNGLRLLRLINDLLDLARLDAAALPVRPQPVDVGAFVERVLEDVRAALAARRLDLTFHRPPQAPVYDLDPTHLERVLLNLLSNAIKFTPAGGLVSVSVRDSAEGLVLAVEDTGEGIPLEAREVVFDRFWQVDGSVTRRHGGTGIGLALVRELTALMGGTVELSAAAGLGSRFTVRFPAALRSREAAVEPATPPADRRADLGRQAVFAAFEEEAAPDGETRAGAHGPRVLVAEDDPVMRSQLVDLLSPSHRVIAVGNGEDALRSVSESVPDVVLTDLMMPRTDGLQLCAALRERTALRDTPIVILSAMGRVDDRIRGRQLGADSYLTKPFHPEELLATVDGLLRARMRLVGSFLVRASLGRGGQGQVFLAEHVRTGEPVALKVVSLAGLADDTARDRLRMEQRALSLIRHPNVVRVVEQGEAEPGFYVAMEYLSGSTLKEVVDAGGPLHPGHVAELARGACRGLDAVHAAGLLHRDVKCSNLMVVGGEEALASRVRLIDFGAVHAEAALEAADRFVGTPAYLAPELVLGQPPSVASDLYALGVALFYMTTGRLPFGGPQPRRIFEAILAGPPPRARDVLPGVPGALDDAIARAMAPRPEDRFRAAAEIAGTLDGLPAGPGALPLPRPPGPPIAEDLSLTPTV